MNDTNASQIITRIERECAALIASIIHQTIPLANLAAPDFLYDEAAARQQLPPVQANAALIAAGDGPGRFIVIDGCKRLLHLQKEKRSECVCGIIPSSSSLLHWGMLRILLNRGRNLNIREQVCFLKWLKTYCRFEDAKALCELLGTTPAHMADLENLLCCDPDVQQAVFDNRIHPANVVEFQVLSKSDRISFFAAFQDCLLSQQNERELLEWLLEIGIRQKKCASELLETDEIKNILKSASLNTPQKIDRVKNHIFSLRYSGYSKLLEEWKSLVREANPDPSNVHFISDPFFEKNRLELRIGILKPDQAVTIFQKLSAISEKTWSKLICPID